MSLFAQSTQLNRDSSCGCQWGSTASMEPLPDGRYSLFAVWESEPSSMDVATKVLSITHPCPMVERTQLQLHLVCRCGHPPAQLEKGQQPLPPTVLRALTNRRISDPHAQVASPTFMIWSFA